MAEESFAGSTNPSPSSSPADEKLESGRTHAQQAAADFKAAAQHKADEFRGQAEAAWNDAKSRAQGWQQDGEQFVRQNPSKSVLYALGVGFVLGLIFRR